ncbi:MAG: S26 family signal peptidase [Phycisphaerales bacterium]|nr:S26 family signal peptidase [Phycisphaerales bacterium]
MSQSSTQSSSEHGTTIIETIQSLIVAFTLAMIFRGFVVEGFVIPTGSMAPTLLGQHMSVQSHQTGKTTAVGLDSQPQVKLIRDHLAGREQPFADQHSATLSGSLWGDRILVAKWLYPFTSPDRWDVVVFRVPTAPEGASGTYIKRLVGLPGETIWIVDGDIFVRASGDDRFHVARKPGHVRETAWQQVWSSDYTPGQPLRLPRGWEGMPWVGQPRSDWKEEGESLESEGTGKATLMWDEERFPLDDWNAYNMFGPVSPEFAVSDLRISGTIIPQADGLSTSLALTARSHVFQFSIAGETASIEMWPLGSPQDITLVNAPIPAMRTGVPMRFVAEHIDQATRLFIDGQQVVELEYDWTPHERLVAAMDKYERRSGEQWTDGQLAERLPVPPALSWSFDGAPVRLSRMEIDRDIYYRPAIITSHAIKNAPLAEFAADTAPGRHGAATHPDHLRVLGPDQFFVLGDNSGRSLDSRLLGSPAPIVAEQVDPAPFVVPRDLLIGKAFLVYFPALTPESVPNFGMLRFIH